MRPLAAQCQARLGRLLRQAGDEEAAQRHLREAERAAVELGMRAWPGLGERVG
jgi:hypothetical protein